MLTEKSFDTGTVKLHYAEGAPSGRALVMLNGVTGMWQQFLPVMPWFLLRYHIYALDLRGHGRSGRTAGAYTISHHAADVIAFLRHTTAEPALLLGWSMGAIVALQVAADAPELVQAIVLEDPPLVLVTDNKEVQAQVRANFRALSTVMASAGTDDDKRAALAALWPNRDEVYIRARFRQLSHFDPAYLSVISDEAQAEKIRLEELLPRVTCPVLLMQADPSAGGVLDEQTLQVTRPLLADCTHIQMQGVGHNMHLDRPADFARIAMDFLESL